MAIALGCKLYKLQRDDPSSSQKSSGFHLGAIWVDSDNPLANHPTKDTALKWEQKGSQCCAQIPGIKSISK